ncbi:MAG: hypothetical protein QOG42_1968, partial [Solirubrobacteraceae bacterium]|nr:hypothetical protein [Solirubrobacteraceae bacterium]
LLASALFADEREDAGSMIFGGGLRSGVWCAGAAADAPAHDDVPIGVIARSGDVTSFLDVWIARRERIEPPPRRYWAGRMAMRPWEVFLAQILQFQCQLADVLEQGSATPTPGYVDPCLARQDALEQALVELGKRPPAREADGIDDGGVQDVVLAKLMARAQALAPVDRGSARHVLIDRGVVELPPAGYLPVDPAGPPTIETQIQALLGAGVDLTFCTTRADAVARELEAAQHLDRISLLRGLDDPRAHEQVDIVVPDAEIQEIAAQDAWHGFLTFGAQAGIRARGALLKAEPRSAQAILKGSGRVGTTDELTIRWAGSSPAAHKAATIVDRARERVVGNEEDAPAENDATRQDPGEDHNGQPDAWLDGTVARDPFALAEGESTRIELIGELAPGPGQHPVHGSFAGSFRLQRSAVQSGGGMRLYGVLTGTAETSTVEDDGKTTHHGPWHLKNEVIVESAATQDGATAVRASLRLEQGELRAVLTWRGGADSVELQAFAGRPDAPGPEGEGAAEQPDGSAATTTVQLAKLALSRDPDAATPANAFRVASERALNALQDALHEPGYAQERLRLLFPQQEAGLRLRATRDWVLFRRRAVLRCGGVAPARVVRETFAVFGVDRTERKVVSKPRPLGEITFDEGAAELAGSTVELGDAWTGDGAELRAIAVLAGPAGSEALYERRGQSLADLLAKTTPRSADFEVGLVPSLPLDPGEADGVMLVSVQQAAKPPTKTVNVAVVLVGRGFAERYLTRMTLATPDVVGALKLIMQEGEHFTVPVDFVAGSADPADESQLGEVVKLYTSKLGGPVQAVHVLSVKPVEDPSEVRGGRGSAVGRALGFDPPPVLYSREKEVFAPARDAKIDQNTMIVVVPSRG